MDAALIAEIAANTSSSLRQFLPSSFSLTPASDKSDQAWERQWRPMSTRRPPNGGWDWPSCRHKAPSGIFTAMWCKRETELCGLLLVRLNDSACCIAMLEGSPNPYHSMRGIVLLTALEFAAMFAQKTGRQDVWICGPIGDMILRHLLTDYGFELLKPRKGFSFCRKAV